MMSRSSSFSINRSTTRDSAGIVGGERVSDGDSPKPGEIECDTTEVVAQPTDELSIEERPVGSAVQEEQDWSTSLIDVVNARAVDIDETTLEGKQLRRKPGWAEIVIRNECS
jgi:hypothetical protein